MRSSDARATIGSWAAAFDASALTVDQCRQVVADVSAMQGMLATVLADASARIADSGTWRSEGDRSAAHQLARETGTTVGAARQTLETGERLRELPALAGIARSGALSAAQTSAVAELGAVAPDLVPSFVARAQETTLAELREECARAAAARQPDPEEQRAWVHAARSLRQWREAGGAQVMQVRDTPEVIAGLYTKLAPVRESLFIDARERGEHVSPDALDVDALVATVDAGYRVATGATAVTSGNDPGGTTSVTSPPHRCAPRAKVLVRIDFDALLRGRPIDGEVCEIAGYGPVAVSAVREMLASGDAFLAAIVTKGEQVVGVAHVGRKALGVQATTLEWINPTCAVDGCTRAVRLEIDHRRDWAATKLTLTDLLDRLCEHHHDLKTREDWALVEGQGKRRFVPPRDPRHPRNPLRRERRSGKPRGDPSAA